ncbi:mobile mystery protein B [Candidatus Odyssella acanthamoebae]|uniref:Mobile mystery protein B n=1 Tax=Candidatus Odyssella acanthamoebae TaxID=91604 RepID=A0A077AUE5_9PROT|nr:mobile mystery protein B [Candidatus Paracaedibacter acanthamoebae]AIK95659.1 mobile mystery protein B [Candidatus Paracaedibacter acanthamoebae]
MIFTYGEGATPFNEDDADKLIPNHIRTQHQLNEWEQANILIAERYLFSRKRNDILTTAFINRIHKKMFGQTWKWAGTFRKHQTNIGVKPYEITSCLKILCDDAKFWVSNQIYEAEEIAVRFHHRLVAIHPYPNGNGRLSRLMGDVLLYNLKNKRLSWGRVSLVQASQTRQEYIRSLREADQGNYVDLLKFAVG